jgi:hypothetical protein
MIIVSVILEDDVSLITAESACGFAFFAPSARANSKPIKSPCKTLSIKDEVIWIIKNPNIKTKHCLILIDVVVGISVGLFILFDNGIVLLEGSILPSFITGAELSLLNSFTL